jgi:ribosomal protein L37AE/L43A
LLSGDFQLAEFSDLEGSDQEEKPTKQQLTKQRSLSQNKHRSKECPGCGALLGLAIRECTYCDYTFTSKSMLPGTQSAIDESRTIRNRFPFEPERVSIGFSWPASPLNWSVVGRGWNIENPIYLWTKVTKRSPQKITYPQGFHLSSSQLVCHGFEI